MTIEDGISYAEDVRDGKIVVGRNIKLAVDRFFKDMERFDMRKGEVDLVLRFTGLLRFSKGKKAGERIVWTRWQIFCLINIFGFYHKGTTKRRFRYFYIEVARKNGKSTFLAAIGLAFLFLFNEATPELYCGASVKAQAEPVFKEMSRMVKRLRRDFVELETNVSVFVEHINLFTTFINNKGEEEETEGIVTMVASNAESLDGLHPFCTLLDELHAHKNSSLFNVFKSGAGGRDNNIPLIAMITTAGFSLQSFAYMIRKNFIQILEGTKTDDSTFIMIFNLDKDDDFNLEENWCKSNPSVGEALDMDYLRDEYRQAQNFPSELNNFLTKNINKWVGGMETWIDRTLLEKNVGRELLEEEIDEGRVYLGIDIGMVNDISALAMITVFGDDRIHVRMTYYMSETAFRRFIAQGIPLDQWADNGCNIVVNPGKVTDTREISKDIENISTDLDVEQIGFDRWSSHSTITKLSESGIEAEAVGQGYQTQNEVIQWIESGVAEERFVFGDDPMLLWMFSNVVLDQDAAGNRKLNKKKADNKIDGVSALFNALFCYIQIDGGFEQEATGMRTIRLR